MARSHLKRTGAFWLLTAAAAWALSDAEKKAIIPWDLGPATIDVSGYPADQQGHYRLFLQKCSYCHTAARAVNADFITRGQWERYVLLMGSRHHARFEVPRWPREETERILQFLTYDAKVRKVDGAKAFVAQQDALRRRFTEVQNEKRARAFKQTGKPSAPYTGAP